MNGQAETAGDGSGWERVSVARGDKPPTHPYGGWYSAQYDDASPAATLVYEGHMAGGASGAGVWAWLLVPTTSARECDADTARIVSANASHVTVSARVAGGGAVEHVVRYK